MLVSPAEPARVKDALREVATVTVSSVTEQYGSDFLIYAADGSIVGVQRKEVVDLIASVGDGRLQREIIQAGALDTWVLLIEGRMQWTNDGLLIARSSWTMSQHLGILWSIQSRGFWIANVDDLAGTVAWLSRFAKWQAKSTHNSLNTRPTQLRRSEFGTVGGLERDKWILQGVDGVGAGLAEAIISHFGRLPIGWTVTKEELMSVKGIGKVKADKLWGALNGREQNGR